MDNTDSEREDSKQAITGLEIQISDLVRDIGYLTKIP